MADGAEREVFGRLRGQLTSDPVRRRLGTDGRARKPAAAPWLRFDEVVLQRIIDAVGVFSRAAVAAMDREPR
jgi:hypothetical protein